jgi:SAM-dependent methyltransferase
MTLAIFAHLAQKAYWTYLLRSLATCLRRSRRRCPCCGARSYDVVARKLAVTALVRCHACRLLYRIPTDPPGLGESLYQQNYTAGFYSDIPPREKLQELIATKFAGSKRDHADYIRVLRALGVAAGARVLELGASWGYGTWQLSQAGYETLGFEPGKARARIAGELLGVHVEDDLNKIGGPFDVLFSAHVLEHFSNPRDAFALAARFVKPGGLFVAFIPNGGLERMRVTPEYHADWGMYHPVYLDHVFFRNAFPDTPLVLTTRPYGLERLRAWNRRESLVFDLIGAELLFVRAVGH